jgi:hypothetical protein
LAIFGILTITFPMARIIKTAAIHTAHQSSFFHKDDQSIPLLAIFPVPLSSLFFKLPQKLIHFLIKVDRLKGLLQPTFSSPPFSLR